MTALDDIAGLDAEVVSFTERLCGMDRAFFILNAIATLGTCPDPKSVMTLLARRQRKEQTQAEMVRVSTGPATYLVYSSPVTKGMFERAPQ